MEPDLREFFQRIVKSLSITVLWMLINMTLGIFFDFGFIHQAISVANILFYIFLLGSLYGLIRYLLKLWKTGAEV